MQNRQDVLKAVLAAMLLLAGCASQPVQEAPGSPGYGEVEKDAEEAQGELDRETAD